MLREARISRHYPSTKQLIPPSNLEIGVETAPNTLSIGLCNSLSSDTVYAYVTGSAVSKNNTLVLLEADGSTLYHPANPKSDGAVLAKNCAIPLGATGSITNITVPYIEGGRIWFCIGNTLTFTLNKGSNGPELVEPGVANSSDPNYNLSWDFCEFTYISTGIFINISYVDFVCLPIALSLTGSDGVDHHVGGLPENGLETVCEGLISQNQLDEAGWDALVVKKSDGSFLRAISPSTGIIIDGSMFEKYWTPYIQQVFAHYVTNTLTVDTQTAWGTSQANTSNDRSTLQFKGIGGFSKPSAADIFGGSSGAFAPQATNTDELLNIGARINAAFNRSTLLHSSEQPSAGAVPRYYKSSVTNHYARILHATDVDGMGYAFPYDDVTPTDGTNVSGSIFDPSPNNVLVTVGGGNAGAKSGRHATLLHPSVLPQNANLVPQLSRRAVSLATGSKQVLAASHQEDLEKGEGSKRATRKGMSKNSSKSTESSLVKCLYRLAIFICRAFPGVAARFQPLLYVLRNKPTFVKSRLSQLKFLLTLLMAIILTFYLIGVYVGLLELGIFKDFLEIIGLANGTKVQRVIKD